MERPNSSSSAPPVFQLRQLISELLPARGLALIHPHRRWSDRLLVLCAIIMSLSNSRALVDRFELARDVIGRLYPSRRRVGVGYNTFIDTLARHSSRLIGIITTSLREALIERSQKHFRSFGFVVLGVDGTKIETPRTDANLEHFGVSNKDHSGPAMLLVAIFHLATRSLWSFAHDHARGSEPGLLRRLITDLPKDSLLVADAGFVGFDTMRSLIDAGHHFIIRAGANVRLITHLCIEMHGDVVWIWPDKMQKKLVAPIILRRIIVQDQKGRVMCLLTSVLDEKRLSERAIRQLYAQRWGIEIAYRWLKTTLDGRKMLSHTPRHAQVELDWTMLSLSMLSLLTLCDATIQAGLSLASALRVVRRILIHQTRRWMNVASQLWQSRTDDYERRSSKTKRHWPKRSRKHDCQTPVARMATPTEQNLYQSLRLATT